MAMGGRPTTMAMLAAEHMYKANAIIIAFGEAKGKSGGDRWKTALGTSCNWSTKMKRSCRHRGRRVCVP